MLGCLRALSELRRKPQNRHLKLVLSMGGAGQSDTFPQVARDPAKRQHFASCAREWIDRYGFDGLDGTWVSITPRLRTLPMTLFLSPLFINTETIENLC